MRITVMRLPEFFLIWVVSFWDSGILCDKAVYVINWYEIIRSCLQLR